MPRTRAAVVIQSATDEAYPCGIRKPTSSDSKIPSISGGGGVLPTQIPLPLRQ